MSETLVKQERQPQPDIPKSRELYRGDINDAVIQVQLATGNQINPAWWAENVGNAGSTESILQRFDDAYEQKILEDTSIVREQPEHRETMEQMAAGTQKEETAWESYRPIGSDEYERTNQERIKDGKIRVVKIGPEQSVTLVASIKVDPETGQAISGHEYRPEAESMIDTERAFADYLAATPPEQRAVIYEGEERVFADRDEAIAKATDSGLIQHLASKERVPMVSGEPTDGETIEVMEKLGVSREELLALYIARGLESQLSEDEADFLAGYINHQAAVLGIEGFHDYSDEEKQAIVAEGRLDEVKAELAKKVEAILPTLNSLYSSALGKDLFVLKGTEVVINPDLTADGDQINWDKLGWSGDQRINEVAKLNMKMRDRVVFHRIIEAHSVGKKPFVVYGGSHIVTIEPALRTYLEEEKIAA